MSSERLRVHKRTREELREMCDQSETYSDVLARILPDDVTDDTKLESPEDEMVVISVTPEMHRLANDLAGENVPVRRMIDYYLVKHRLATTVPPGDVLNRTYTND